MPAKDWPTGSVVKRDLDEEIVQAAMADDEARKGLLDGIEDAKTDGDQPGVGKLTALLHEADRRRLADLSPRLSTTSSRRSSASYVVHMTKTKHSHTGYRSSKTGRFVPKKHAERNPSTTQKESIPNPGRGDTGRRK